MKCWQVNPDCLLKQILLHYLLDNARLILIIHFFSGRIMGFHTNFPDNWYFPHEQIHQATACFRKCIRWFLKICFWIDINYTLPLMFCTIIDKTTKMVTKVKYLLFYEIHRKIMNLNQLSYLRTWPSLYYQHHCTTGINHHPVLRFVIIFSSSSSSSLPSSSPSSSNQEYAHNVSFMKT